MTKFSLCVQRALFASIGLIGALLLTVPGAQAAFPGHNGKIAFLLTDANQTRIHTVNPDGSGLTAISTGDTQPGGPAWSPDGTKIAFVGVLPNQGIYVMDGDGSNLSKIYSLPGTHLIFGLVWSPDGTKLAFTEVLNEAHIVIIDADGSNPTDLTGGSFDTMSAWSPDGSKVVFSRSDDETLGGRLFVMNIDRTNLTQLTNPGDQQYDYFPDYSPDGETIVFGRYDVSTGASEPSQTILVVAADGGTPTALTAAPFQASHPRFSPDGTKIVFDTWEIVASRHRYQIATMNPDGSAVSPVPNTSGSVSALGGRGPDWQRLAQAPVESSTTTTTSVAAMTTTTTTSTAATTTTTSPPPTTTSRPLATIPASTGAQPGSAPLGEVESARGVAAGRLSNGDLPRTGRGGGLLAAGLALMTASVAVGKARRSIRA